MNMRRQAAGFRAPTRSTNCKLKKEKQDQEQGDELSFFRDLRKQQMDNSLLNPISDHEFEATAAIEAEDIKGISSSRLEILVDDDGGKNDYNWLKTPPATPLFPSLEMEAYGGGGGRQQLVIQKEIPILLHPVSRFAGINNGQGAEKCITSSSSSSSSSTNPRKQLMKVPSQQQRLSSSATASNMKSTVSGKLQPTCSAATNRPGSASRVRPSESIRNQYSCSPIVSRRTSPSSATATATATGTVGVLLGSRMVERVVNARAQDQRMSRLNKIKLNASMNDELNQGSTFRGFGHGLGRGRNPKLSNDVNHYVHHASR